MHSFVLKFLVVMFTRVIVSNAFVNSFQTKMIQKRSSSSAKKLFCFIKDGSPPAYIARIEGLVDMTNFQSQVARVKDGCSVVPKGKFQVGDLAVYVGVDSIVNITKPPFRFLKEERIRPYKVEGELTHGVIGPLSWLEKEESSFKEGDDVSGILGVTKYIPTNDPGLATIEKIVNLIPIPGKDLIEIAVVKGWKCIVQKGLFKVGDLAIYLALDSVPDLHDPNFAFLKQKGLNRVKTMRIGAVISQGLVCPLSWLTDRGAEHVDTLREGDNVAALMGVTKHIAEEESGQYKQKSSASKNELFPSFVPKTDATRLQTDPDRFLGAIADRNIVITRKEDGCSATFVHNAGAFAICGRNFIWSQSDKSCSHYFQMAAQLDLQKKLSALGRNIAIQGELCGPKINMNRHKLTHNTFRVFDIFDIDLEKYASFDEMTVLCAALGLDPVPLLYRGAAENAVPSLTVDHFLAFADRLEYCPGAPAEGIVVKTDPITDFGARTHFKIISNKYLMKHDL